MKNAKLLLFGIIGALMLTAGAAHAQRRMVVMIDASGSMQTIRLSDGQTRFEAARTLAKQAIQIRAMQTEGLQSVAVFMFHDLGVTAHTAGFVTPFQATTAIDGLAVTSDLTPLAAGLCEAIDSASASGGVTGRLIEVFSDGFENNTPPAHECFGPFSVVLETAPFDAGSWQNKVYVKATNIVPSVALSATLFTNVQTAAFGSANAPVDLESAKLAQTGRSFPLAAAAAVTDEQFFAILLARQFGDEPADPAFDLDADGVVGFADYTLLLGLFGTGTGEPEPDPYVQADPVTCVGGRGMREIVIDGKVIENAGQAAALLGGCRVIIRNSLIVSGQVAILQAGAAQLIVDNSIIVGEDAWLIGSGVVLLSAANSIFHGAQQVFGVFGYVDRGGNVFE